MSSSSSPNSPVSPNDSKSEMSEQLKEDTRLSHSLYPLQKAIIKGNLKEARDILSKKPGLLNCSPPRNLHFKQSVPIYQLQHYSIPIRELIVQFGREELFGVE